MGFVIKAVCYIFCNRLISVWKRCILFRLEFVMIVDTFDKQLN